jgi:hypothetical protein
MKKKANRGQVQPDVILPYDVFASLFIAVALADKDDEICRKAFKQALPSVSDFLKQRIRKGNKIITDVLDKHDSK